MLMNHKMRFSRIFIYIIAISFSILCIIPFLLVIGGSLTSEAEIRAQGYKIIPEHFTLEAYRILWVQSKVIIQGYVVSMVQTVAGTILSLVITAMLAYAVSIRYLPGRRILSIYVLITMLFNGGMVSWYIICVNYLHLKDNYLALIVPYLVSAFNVFLIRNYFQSISEELYESAKLDGAGEYTIFFKIVLPLSKPVLATVALFVALMYWNDWWLGLMLIDKDELKPLQLLLRSISSNINFLKTSEEAAKLLGGTNQIPTESVKFATCVVTIGPIVFLYPFLQKYFVKGIMIGAIKG